jgi:putative intracellular protease/amidase
MAGLSAHRVGILGFDGVAGLDLMGPVEVFMAANEALPAGASPYEVAVVAPSAGPFTTESNVRMLPHLAADAPGLKFDTVIVPGGPGLREPGTNAWAACWLRAQAAHAGPLHIGDMCAMRRGAFRRCGSKPMPSTFRTVVFLLRPG